MSTSRQQRGGPCRSSWEDNPRKIEGKKARAAKRAADAAEEANRLKRCELDIRERELDIRERELNK